MKKNPSILVTFGYIFFSFLKSKILCTTLKVSMIPFFSNSSPSQSNSYNIFVSYSFHMFLL